VARDADDRRLLRHERLDRVGAPDLRRQIDLQDLDGANRGHGGYPYMSRGSHSEICGMYVISIREGHSGTSHGMIAIVVFSTDSPDTRASTNSTIPIGGCRRPIIRFSTMTRPK